MTTEFKDALEAFNKFFAYEGDWPDDIARIYIGHVKTIRRALTIADKLMQEPSEGMLAAASKEWDGRISVRASGVFEAMRDALLKECE